MPGCLSYLFQTLEMFEYKVSVALSRNHSHPDGVVAVQGPRDVRNCLELEYGGRNAFLRALHQISQSSRDGEIVGIGGGARDWCCLPSQMSESMNDPFAVQMSLSVHDAPK